MIVDFHTHIFPPQICQNRTDFFQSESAFKTIYQSPKSRLVSAPELLNIMDESEVDKAVIFGFPWRNIETIKLHNDYIIEMVQKYSNRFIGLCCFEPSGEQTIAETERLLERSTAKLANANFTEHAPADVVAAEKERVIEHTTKLEKLRTQLAELA